MTQTTKITASPMRFGGELKPAQDIFSLDHVKRQDRLVSLIPIISQKHKEPRISFTSYCDDSGVFYGIPIKLKEDGTFQFKRITVDGNIMFNLNNINEAKDFEILRLSPFVEGGMRSVHIPVLYKVHDPEVNAQKDLIKARLRNKVSMYIDSLTDTNLTDFALVVFGSIALKNSKNVNLQMLMKEANDNPEKIQGHINNRQGNDVEAVFQRALATQLIRLDETRGYLTEHGAFLGYDKLSCYTKISSQSELLRQLDYESKKRLNNDTLTTPGKMVTSQQEVDLVRARSMDIDDSMILPSGPHQEADFDPWLEASPERQIPDVVAPEESTEIASSLGPKKITKKK